jgi:flagellar assembly protein FliH
LEEEAAASVAPEFEDESDEDSERDVSEERPVAPKVSEQKLVEETRRSFEAGRERGRQEGKQLEQEAHASALAAEAEHYKTQLVTLTKSFAAERDRFLSAIEQETVKLALAVAARILRREAQMDPLLLTGAVRVALGQLAGTTEVKLKVPAEELDLWTEAIAHIPNLALKPTVEAGEGMRLGDCAIESKVGSVDLGIRAQLAEIERGFFDRAVASRNSAAQNVSAGEAQS